MGGLKKVGPERRAKKIRRSNFGSGKTFAGYEGAPRHRPTFENWADPEWSIDGGRDHPTRRDGGRGSPHSSSWG